MVKPSVWSRTYRGRIYERPPAFVQDPTSRDLSLEECRTSVVKQFPGKPMFEEHQRHSLVGRVIKCDQDHEGTLWADFQLLTNTPTYRKVTSGEMRSLSIGHEIIRTFPHRTINVVELSVCKNGERPNTLIVNASAAKSIGDFFSSFSPPRVLHIMSFPNMGEGGSWIPVQPPLPPAPVRLPMKFVVGDKEYEWMPTQVNASGAPQQQQPQQQLQQSSYPAPQAMPMPPQGNVSMGQGQVPWPFNEMNTRGPWNYAQPQQQMQQQQMPMQAVPAQQQQQQPEPGAPAAPVAAADTRNKTKKRLAEDAAVPEADSADGMEEEGKTKFEGVPAAKKANTTKAPAATAHDTGNVPTSSSATAPETPSELKEAMEQINRSNAPMAAKVAANASMLQAFKLQKTMADDAVAKLKSYVAIIEPSMRQQGRSSEDVAKWKEGLKSAFEKPLDHSSVISSLEAHAASVRQSNSSNSSSSNNNNNNGYGSSSSYSGMMPTGLTSDELMLQRQMEQANQFMNHSQHQAPIPVMSSALSAPPAFPVTGRGQLPMVRPDGTTTVFVPQFTNPNLLDRNLQTNVTIDGRQGWVTGGVPQRQQFYQGPIDDRV